MIHGFNLDALTCYEKNDGNKKPAEYAGFLNMAESEGFEPPVGLTLRLISSQDGFLLFSKAYVKIW